ncbi:hypothetical protein [Myroides sp. DF42-4-2]|uniref:hypothetical protein n=1 Tax=unclassified Myroides TaxID=2642485 RepID=UPI0025764430|nr:hypothetical protein [Myroides sp. DF42-4-2]MDM1406726.1 hypothetical protein [Myroides sp. DF42-4-2]
MKKKILLFALLGGFMLSTTACSSDDSNSGTEQVEVPNTLKDDYFNIEGATFNAGSIESGTAEAIAEINVNNFIINGGKAIMTVSSTAQLQSIHIGLKGHDGYYDVKTSNENLTRNGLYSYEVILDFSQDLILDIVGLELVGYITDGTRTILYYRELQVIPAGTGELQISLSWDREDDVDLHLVKRNVDRIYYGSRQLHNADGEKIAELDIDSNPACRIDGIKNENIYFDRLEDGVYSIYVDLYRKCEVSGSVGSKYIVNVMYNGTSIRLSDHMIGKFDDTDTGSGNTESRHVLIGSFSVVNGSFSSVVEEEATTRTLDTFGLSKKMIYTK